MIKKERLAAIFKTFVEIDSVSKEEKAVSDEIIKIVTALNGKIVIDGSKTKTGSNTGNLIVRIEGNTDAVPMLLAAHMDTVEPGRGVKAIYKDGVFTSDGSTVLGADDKSAIAIILETLFVLKENNLPHGLIELVFTTCEEVGLVGAKNLDYSLLLSKHGYVLDSADTEGIVVQAPASNNLEFKILGKDAHAGARPDDGINAIHIAAKAIAGLNLGRIDDETTCNIGIIEGGVATNIIPNFVRVKGEARSHDEEKLKRVTGEIVAAFETAVNNYPKTFPDEQLPRLETKVTHEFSRTLIPSDHIIIKLAREASANLGREMLLKKTGGGSDANIFFKKNIISGVIGTGMQDIHTVRENIQVSDMVKAVELLLEIIRLNSAGSR